jgi:hypothetical protein
MTPLDLFNPLQEAMPTMQIFDLDVEHDGILTKVPDIYSEEQSYCDFSSTSSSSCSDDEDDSDSDSSSDYENSKNNDNATWMMYAPVHDRQQQRRQQRRRQRQRSTQKYQQQQLVLAVPSLTRFSDS